MKLKIYLLIISMMQFYNCFSQSSGKVMYKINNIDFEVSKVRDENSMASKMVDEALKNAKSQVFELTFTTYKSKFKIIESSIQSDNQLINKFASARFTSGFSYFLDKKQNVELFLYSNGTLVADNYQNKNWQITSETKTIDTYLCYKAIYKYDYLARDQKTKTRTITAWFAPSLPYSYGPKNYNGLPGLILELQDWNTTFLATEISLSDEIIDIKFPQGKTITDEEYRKAMSSY